jgi:tRNA A37 threonylcarbamoyladenosine dehydratase
MFADVKALVLGCGSGGGSVGLQLVMSGIRNFTLVDCDVLGPENALSGTFAEGASSAEKKLTPSLKCFGTEIRV